MDAYAFVGHGGVFANAQTGNIVMLAAYATIGNWNRAMRHFPPIVTFIVGVAFAKFVISRKSRIKFMPRLCCQVLELSALVTLTAFASRLPNVLVVPFISCVAGLQVGTFDSVTGWKFDSAMATGNIKSMTTGFVRWFQGEDVDRSKGQALVSACACASFFVGALFGAYCTRRFRTYALAPCVLLVLMGSLLTWTQHSTIGDDA